MNRSLRYWRVAAILGVMIPVDVHILLGWNHQWGEIRWRESWQNPPVIGDPVALVSNDFSKEKKRRKMPPGATGRRGIWWDVDSRACIWVLWECISTERKWKMCILSIHNYTILYYRLYIYILYIIILYIYISYIIALGVRVKLTHSLPRFELPSTTRWMRSILTSASLAKERLRSSGSARREANRISGRKDAPSSGAERFGLNIEVSLSISWRFFGEFPDHNPIGSLADEA